MKARTFTVVAALAGLAAGTILVGWFGLHRVLRAALSVGWHGLAVLILWQGVVFLLLGVAWWMLLPKKPAAPVLIWARMVRDATSNCLPFSAVGGFVFGARVANLGGLAWPMASASTLADVTTEFLSQLVFAAGGLALLVIHRPGSPFTVPFAVGIGIGVLAGVVFVALQLGSQALTARLLGRLKRPRLKALAGHLAAMQRELREIYSGTGLLAAASTLHLAAWVANGVGSWLIMLLMGARIGLPAALAIEGLLQAVLTLAFPVPGFAGVQELAYVGLGGLFGLAPETAIAVSLVRRARDVAVGVPILLVWQLVEARRLKRRHSHAAHVSAGE